MGVRSHGSGGLMTLTDLVLTPSARSGKYLCLLVFVSARTSATCQQHTQQAVCQRVKGIAVVVAAAALHAHGTHLRRSEGWSAVM